jgi:hypothetical protein
MLHVRKDKEGRAILVQSEIFTLYFERVQRKLNDLDLELYCQTSNETYIENITLSIKNLGESWDLYELIEQQPEKGIVEYFKRFIGRNKKQQAKKPILEYRGHSYSIIDNKLFIDGVRFQG